MVFQAYSFPTHDRPGGNGIGLEVRGMGKAERHQDRHGTAGLVGLAIRPKVHAADVRRPAKRRGPGPRAGRQARVLLDEPLSALDAKVRVQLRDQIRASNSPPAPPPVFVTHDQGRRRWPWPTASVMNKRARSSRSPPPEPVPAPRHRVRGHVHWTHQPPARHPMATRPWSSASCRCSPAPKGDPGPVRARRT